jgi:hypothetical protein
MMRDMRRDAAVRRDDAAGEHVYRARLGECPGHDEHQRDDDDSRMTEAREGLVLVDDPMITASASAPKRHNVVADAAPHEHGEDAAHDGEKDDLVKGHVWGLPSHSKWGYQTYKRSAHLFSCWQGLADLAAGINRRNIASAR